MPLRTQVMQILPWTGGVNSSLDPSMIPPQQLTEAENITQAETRSRLKRQGINFNWDSGTIVGVSRASSGTTRTIVATGYRFKTGQSVTIYSSGSSSYNGTFTITGTSTTSTTNDTFTFTGTGSLSETTTADTALRIVVNSNIIAGHDYWYGAVSRSQYQVAVSEDKNVYAYESDGDRFQLTFANSDWASNVTTGSIISFNNRAIIAVDGALNPLKVWDGTSSSNTVKDLKNKFNHVGTASSGRSSSGTTRTIQLPATFKGFAGDTIIVENASAPNAASYNGVWTVASVTTTSITNDTITFTGVGSLAEAGTTDTTITIDGQAPRGSILQQHLGRVWTNDKSNKDRLHYSETFDHEIWGGYGDSGAIDIGVGDGDPDGIIAIFPTFKGDLFVAKRRKLYRLSGGHPAEMSIQLVSDGIGCISHNAVAAVDQDDVVFVSERGIHSLQASANYGAFSGTFLSQDIQGTFNDVFSRPRFKYAHAAYLSSINSVAFAFTEIGRDDTDLNNVMWLYNFQDKAWYYWIGRRTSASGGIDRILPCAALWTARDNDRLRFYLGTDVSRLGKTFNETNYDIDHRNVQHAVRYRVASGLIYPDQNPYTIKGFKRFFLVYKPVGQQTITVELKIDNFRTQSLSFTESSSGALLGDDFTLGVSSLGYEVIMQPYTQSMDGYGRGVKISIEQIGLDEVAEIQGFGFEYEMAETSQETRTGDT